MRVVLALGALLVAATTMAISTCGSSVPGPSHTPAPTIQAPRTLTETPIGTPPEFIPPDPLFTFVPGVTPMPLTGDQEQQLKDIIRADPRMAEITGDVSYILQHPRQWNVDGAGTDGGDLLGGHADILLSRAIDRVQYDWPSTNSRDYYAYWPAETREKYGPYEEVVENYTVENLREMSVTVDLIRGVVVAIFAGEDLRYQQTVVTNTPGAAPLFTTGASPEAMDIFNADPRVQAILSGRPHQALDVISYTVAGVQLATIRVVFENSHDLEADWPLLFRFDPETGVYTVDTIHFAAPYTASMLAIIDLSKGEVAWLVPEDQRELGD